MLCDQCPVALTCKANQLNEKLWKCEVCCTVYVRVHGSERITLMFHCDDVLGAYIAARCWRCVTPPGQHTHTVFDLDTQEGRVRWEVHKRIASLPQVLGG